MTKKKISPKNTPIQKLRSQNKALKIELEEANETLRAIRNGEVDALVMSGEHGEKIFTLKNADQPYRILVESMNEGAVTLSSDATIFYCNKRFSDILETTIENLIGLSIYNFIKSDEITKFEKVFSLGKLSRGADAFLLKTKKGNPIPIHLSMSYSEINGKAGVCVIATDLTQQIRFKEYEILAVELEEAVKARDEFISIASHELKTPLTSLMLQTQLHKKMIQKKDSNAFDEMKIVKLVEQTEILTKKLSRLVEDMLEITRIKSDKLSIHKVIMDLGKLTNDIINRMDAQLMFAGGKKPITKTSKAVGLWDPMRIEQVISNLLNNAIKYGKGSSIEVTVSSSKGIARFSIKDEGIGISKEDQSKIFKRFERAVHANEISGLGLGLYISQQIIEAHKGRIWVESQIGKGSTFYFELPMDSKKVNND